MPPNEGEEMMNTAVWYTSSHKGPNIAWSPTTLVSARQVEAPARRTYPTDIPSCTATVAPAYSVYSIIFVTENENNNLHK